LATSSARLPFDDENVASGVSRTCVDTVDARIAARDRAARERAVNPRFNVALEASAGTGKTRVLVDRYINLLRAGVDPVNILAITFTRKAAAEMRDRIMGTLRAAAARGEIPAAHWRTLRDRTSDIAVGTIDAFCLSLLREFPLEADVDPGFSVADDTELPRFIDESLDRALRICRAAARQDEHVALVFAQLGERRTRAALATLLERRLVAPDVLHRYLARVNGPLDGAAVGQSAATTLVALFESMRGGLDRFIDSGPLAPAFELFARDLRRLSESLRDGLATPQAVGAVFARAREHFLTQEGNPRSRSPYPQKAFANAADWRLHGALVVDHAEPFARLDAAYRRDLNVLLSHGLQRMFRIADAEYRRTLEAHAVLDFSDLVQRAVNLLRRMDEFSRSRYRLESRYHHVLVDEFQDTSRAQWELVSLLVQSWEEGAGLADTGPLHPSIFIVGDRKQSIYGFRDADVSVLRQAARHIGKLRPDGDVRRSISRSFRAVPPLLAFVNDVCQDMDKTAGGSAFQYEEGDRFPIELDAAGSRENGALGVVLGVDSAECAGIVAAEIARLLSDGTAVRDRDTGVARPIRPGDVAILFRSRESHREFEAALAHRNMPSYVYKGLGFFDADEIKDGLALVQYLADPASDLRAAALMRSRFFGVSDEALRRLAPHLADVLLAADFPAAVRSLDAMDAAAVSGARASTARWRALVDRVGPAELVDTILTESAYDFELRATRFEQARENLKKLRALLRRLQNRGYSTVARVGDHLDRVAVGDQSNAVLEALNAVNLMTVHASKGLEFPVVFLVNLARGTGNRRGPVRWASDSGGEEASVAVADFQPEADERLNSQEREETKRLVYVALTRARDRLYLASTLKDGYVTPSRGSLAEVLPASLLRQLGGNAHDRLEWHASSGAVHRLNVCSSDLAEPNRSPEVSAWDDARSSSDADFIPLQDTVPPPQTVASLLESGGDNAPGREPDTARSASHRLVGTLVHWLLQRFGIPLEPVEITTDIVVRVLNAHNIASMDDGGCVTEVAADAAAAYRSICDRADVRDLYRAGDPLHEVPFTMRVDGRVIRGTIDCLVRTASDRMTLFEFKTGRARDDDQLQLDLYRQAAEHLFPGTIIDARLVYAAEP
jgi:ATP-dependent helicase/nuclease subunit A